MKGRTFDKMVLSLSRQGLQVAHVSSVELSAEEARRRGYKKEAYYIVEPVTTQCAWLRFKTGTQTPAILMATTIYTLFIIWDECWYIKFYYEIY